LLLSVAKEISVCVRILALVLVVTAALPEVCAAQTTPQNDQFQVDSSNAGIASIKRVPDKFDTGYIAPARSLGDLLIGYRDAGQQEWRRASAAVIDPAGAGPGQTTIAYTVGELVPTIATTSQATASVEPWEVWALKDQIEPTNSHDAGVPKFAWHRKKGTADR
jgi:hypothetical protein